MRCVRNCHAPASPRTRTVCANRCADVPTVANVHDVAAMRPTTATSMLAYSIDPCVCCVLVVRSNVFNAPTTSTGWYLFIFLLVVFLFLLFLFSVALVTCCVCVCMCVLLATRFWLVELFHGYTICIYLFIHICQVYTLFDNSKYTRRWRRVLCTSPWLLFRRYILLSCSLSGISNTSGTGCGLWEVYDDGLRVKLLAYINSLIDCESMKYSINWISIDDDVDFADRQWWWAFVTNWKLRDTFRIVVERWHKLLYQHFSICLQNFHGMIGACYVWLSVNLFCGHRFYFLLINALQWKWNTK